MLSLFKSTFFMSLFNELASIKPAHKILHRICSRRCIKVLSFTLTVFMEIRHLYPIILNCMVGHFPCFHIKGTLSLEEHKTVICIYTTFELVSTAVEFL